MKVLALGPEERLAALQGHPVETLNPVWYRTDGADALPPLDGYTHIIDLNLDEVPQRLKQYAMLKGVIVVGCAVKQTLATMTHAAALPLYCKLYGANLLPGFLQRHTWEVSSLLETKQDEMLSALAFLPFSCLPVADQVGMVTARVVCRIVNEAYYMLQEGSANRCDIEMAMKLGVNYPYGPFEWAERIGLRHVYDVLMALQADLGSDQYTVCPLLKRSYMSQNVF